MRNPPPSRINTWMGHKEQARIHFQNQDYEEALASYRAALNPEYACPPLERQVVLSNVVACRLKIGGSAMASAAVEDAKQCIALNESWAKGHVRLASAYIALGGHSNDACNSLQRAIALDPGNSTARQMLMRELRRDRVAPPTPADDPQPAASARPTPSAPPEEQLEEEEDVIFVDENLEDNLRWTDRLKFHYDGCVAWYNSQSDDVKTLLKVLLGLVVLYIAFGGRFGLDQVFGTGNKLNRGNYEVGNAYERYRNRAASSSYDDYSHQGQRYREQESSFPPPRRSQSTSYRSSSSFHFPNLLDGSPQSMLVLAGILYVCYRNGISPWQVMMFMNIARGGRRRMPMRGMGGGYGMGYGHRRGGFRY